MPDTMNEDLSPQEQRQAWWILAINTFAFTVCFAAPNAERPTEFTTKDGKATLLHVWKRLPDEIL